MSNLPAQKRARIHESPPASIDSLPDAVLQVCFSFLGSGHYRFAAGTCRRFREVYSSKNTKQTTWVAAAASVPCAQLCLEEIKQQAKANAKEVLDAITCNAIKTKQVDVLGWARNSGYEFCERHFLFAARFGHLYFLQWAEEENIIWYTEDVPNAAIMFGKTEVLDWILERGQLIPPIASQLATYYNHMTVLRWLKEHNLLSVDDTVWIAAASQNDVEALDWLYQEGYDPDVAVLAAAVQHDRREVITWARDHGVDSEYIACAVAAYAGNLPLLQWLRENDFPWDGNVLFNAIAKGHHRVAQWATENGCPTELLLEDDDD